MKYFQNVVYLLISAKPLISAAAPAAEETPAAEAPADGKKKECHMSHNRYLVLLSIIALESNVTN